MKKRITYILAIVLVAFSQFSEAHANTDLFDKSKKKTNKSKTIHSDFSLKSLRSHTSAFSLSSLKYYQNDPLEKPTELPDYFHPQQYSDLEYVKPIQVQNGNTTYTINVKVKLKPANPIPFMKAPEKSNFR